MRTKVRDPEMLTDPDYQDRRPIPVAAAGFIAALDQRVATLLYRLMSMKDQWVGSCTCCRTAADDALMVETWRAGRRGKR